ncbi:hypothetical protein COCNU_13G005910 [Cocos nucifera]|uniref:Uncharacterized protein n=1 Tax=Cocos nucifera TaxID=13894 RepID=A0A8K0IT83_COCNU|nr:hypothetical protein COCNU_13G005910 [Cocos nucifera]
MLMRRLPACKRKGQEGTGIMDVDVNQHAWDSLGSFLKTGYQLLGYIRSLNCLSSELEKAHEDHQIEVERLIKEQDEVDCSLKRKTIEVEVLQEALHKEKEASEELRTTLSLEEEWRRREALCKEKEASEELRTALGLEEEYKRRVEAKTAKLKEQISRQISEVTARTIEEFKIFFEMRDLNVRFGQEAFNKGYELYEEWVANKFLELDFDFLYEGASEEVADPSIIMTDVPLTKLASTTPPTSPTPTTIERPVLTEAIPDFSTIPPKV